MAIGLGLDDVGLDLDRLVLESLDSLRRLGCLGGSSAAVSRLLRLACWSARRRDDATRRVRDDGGLGAARARADVSRRSSSRRETMTVMWHERLRILPARPRARGVKRFMVTPSSAKAAETKSSSAFMAVVVHRVRDGRREHLADHVGGLAGRARQDLAGGGDVLAANEVEHHASLARGHVVAAQRGAGSRTFVGLGTGH